MDPKTYFEDTRGLRTGYNNIAFQKEMVTRIKDYKILKWHGIDDEKIAGFLGVSLSEIKTLNGEERFYDSASKEMNKKIDMIMENEKCDIFEAIKYYKKEVSAIRPSIFTVILALIGLFFGLALLPSSFFGEGISIKILIWALLAIITPFMQTKFRKKTAYSFNYKNKIESLKDDRIILNFINLFDLVYVKLLFVLGSIALFFKEDSRLAFSSQLANGMYYFSFIIIPLLYFISYKLTTRNLNKKEAKKE